MDFEEGLLISINQASLISGVHVNDILFMMSFRDKYSGRIPECIIDEKDNSIFFTNSETLVISECYKDFSEWVSHNYDNKGRLLAEEEKEDDIELDDIDYADNADIENESNDSAEEIDDEDNAIVDDEPIDNDDADIEKEKRDKKRKLQKKRRSEYQKAQEAFREIEDRRLENKRLEDKKRLERISAEETARIDAQIHENSKKINQLQSTIYASTSENVYNEADKEAFNKISNDAQKDFERQRELQDKLHRLESEFQNNRDSFNAEHEDELKFAKTVNVEQYDYTGERYVEDFIAIENSIKDDHYKAPTKEDLDYFNGVVKTDVERHSGFDFSHTGDSEHRENYNKEEYVAEQDSINKNIEDYNRAEDIKKNVVENQHTKTRNDAKSYVDQITNEKDSVSHDVEYGVPHSSTGGQTYQSDIPPVSTWVINPENKTVEIPSGNNGNTTLHCTNEQYRQIEDIIAKDATINHIKEPDYSHASPLATDSSGERFINNKESIDNNHNPEKPNKDSKYVQNLTGNDVTSFIKAADYQITKTTQKDEYDSDGYNKEHRNSNPTNSNIIYNTPKDTIRSFSSFSEYNDAQSTTLREMKSIIDELQDIDRRNIVRTNNYSQLNKESSLRDNTSVLSSYFDKESQSAALHASGQSFNTYSSYYKTAKYYEDSLILERISSNIAEIKNDAKERLNNTKTPNEQLVKNVEAIKIKAINEVLMNAPDMFKQQTFSADEYINKSVSFYEQQRKYNFEKASTQNTESVYEAKRKAEASGQTFSVKDSLNKFSEERAKISADCERKIYGTNAALAGYTSHITSKLKEIAIQELNNSLSEHKNVLDAKTMSELYSKWTEKASDENARTLIKVSKAIDKCTSALKEGVSDERSAAFKDISKKKYEVVKILANKTVAEQTEKIQIDNIKSSYDKELKTLIRSGLSPIELRKHADELKNAYSIVLKDTLSSSINKQRTLETQFVDGLNNLNEAVNVQYKIKSSQKNGQENVNDKRDDKAAKKLLSANANELKNNINEKYNKKEQAIDDNVQKILNAKDTSKVRKLYSGSDIKAFRLDNDIKALLKPNDGAKASVGYAARSIRYALGSKIPAKAATSAMDFAYRKIKDLPTQMLGGTTTHEGFRTVIAAPVTILSTIGAIGSNMAKKDLANDLKNFTFNDFKGGQRAVMRGLGFGGVMTEDRARAYLLNSCEKDAKNLDAIIKNADGKFTKSQQFAAQFIQRQQQGETLRLALSKFTGKTLNSVQDIKPGDVFGWLNNRFKSGSKMPDFSSFSITKLKDMLKQATDEEVKAALTYAIQYKKMQGNGKALGKIAGNLKRNMHKLRNKLFGGNETDDGFNTVYNLYSYVNRGLKTAYKAVRTGINATYEITSFHAAHLEARIANKLANGKDVSDRLLERYQKISGRREKMASTQEKLGSIREKMKNRRNKILNKAKDKVKNFAGRGATSFNKTFVGRNFKLVRGKVNDLGKKFASSKFGTAAGKVFGGFGKAFQGVGKAVGSALKTVGKFFSVVYEILLWIILILIGAVLIMFLISYIGEFLLASVKSSAFYEETNYFTMTYEMQYYDNYRIREGGSLESRFYNELAAKCTSQQTDTIRAFTGTDYFNGFIEPWQIKDANGNSINTNHHITSFGYKDNPDDPEYIRPYYLTPFNGDGNQLVASAGPYNLTAQMTNMRTIMAMLDMKMSVARSEGDNDVDVNGNIVYPFLANAAEGAIRAWKNNQTAMRYVVKMFNFTHYYTLSVGVKDTEDSNPSLSDSNRYAVTSASSVTSDNLLICKNTDCQQYLWSCVSPSCDINNAHVHYSDSTGLPHYSQKGCLREYDDAQTNKNKVITHYYCCVCDKVMKKSEWASHLKSTDHMNNRDSSIPRTKGDVTIDFGKDKDGNPIYFNECAGHPVTNYKSDTEYTIYRNKKTGIQDGAGNYIYSQSLENYIPYDEIESSNKGLAQKAYYQTTEIITNLNLPDICSKDIRSISFSNNDVTIRFKNDNNTYEGYKSNENNANTIYIPLTKDYNNYIGKHTGSDNVIFNCANTPTFLSLLKNGEFDSSRCIMTKKTIYIGKLTNTIYSAPNDFTTEYNIIIICPKSCTGCEHKILKDANMGFNSVCAGITVEKDSNNKLSFSNYIPSLQIGHDSRYCGGHVQLYADFFTLYATDKINEPYTTPSPKTTYSLGGTISAGKASSNPSWNSDIFKTNNSMAWPNLWSIATQCVESQYSADKIVVWDTHPSEREDVLKEVNTLRQEPMFLVSAQKCLDCGHVNVPGYDNNTQQSVLIRCPACNSYNVEMVTDPNSLVQDMYKGPSLASSNENKIIIHWPAVPSTIDINTSASTNRKYQNTKNRIENAINYGKLYQPTIKEDDFVNDVKDNGIFAGAWDALFGG